jgi:hypothetical protein
MAVDLASLFNLYQFSTGRRIFALQQVLKAAKKLKLADLEAHVVAAIKHDRTTRKLDVQWQKQGSRPKSQGDASRIDPLVDRTLTALRDGAAAQAEGAAPDEDIVEKVDAFIAEIFPSGVTAVTQLSYVDELSAVDEIVAKLKGELAPTVKELGLTRQAARLAKLAGEYRAALETQPAPALDFGTVRAARAQGQNLMLQAIAMIVGMFPTNRPNHEQARAALLTPILKQNEAIAQYLRTRRTVEDVNPETGEVESEASAPEVSDTNDTKKDI